MRRLGHATQEAALRYQHAPTNATGCGERIDRLIQAAREEPTAPVVPLRASRGDR